MQEIISPAAEPKTSTEQSFSVELPLNIKRANTVTVIFAISSVI